MIPPPSRGSGGSAAAGGAAAAAGSHSPLPAGPGTGAAASSTLYAASSKTHSAGVAVEAAPAVALPVPEIQSVYLEGSLGSLGSSDVMVMQTLGSDWSQGASGTNPGLVGPFGASGINGGGGGGGGASGGGPGPGTAAAGTAAAAAAAAGGGDAPLWVGAVTAARSARPLTLPLIHDDAAAEAAEAQADALERRAQQSSHSQQ